MPDDRNRIKKSRMDYVQLSMDLKTPVPLTDVDENNKNGVVVQTSLPFTLYLSILPSKPPPSVRFPQLPLGRVYNSGGKDVKTKCLDETKER